MRPFSELWAALSPEAQERARLWSDVVGRHIDHVQQSDSHGCLLACLSMATGLPYAAVKAWFEAGGATFTGESGGITEHTVCDFLGEHGYAWRRAYRVLSPGNRLREQWPLSPFAPVHIVGVQGAGRHGVVMLYEGTVLDPLDARPRTLDEYSDVAYMLGIWPIQKP